MEELVFLLPINTLSLTAFQSHFGIAVFGTSPNCYTLEIEITKITINTNQHKLNMIYCWPNIKTSYSHFKKGFRGKCVRFSLFQKITKGHQILK